MTTWTRTGAERVIRERAHAAAVVAAVAEAGPCPACGADAAPELFDVSTYDYIPRWAIGMVDCSAHCYETDPERYLAAIAPPKPVVKFDPEWMNGDDYEPQSIPDDAYANHRARRRWWRRK